MRIFGIRLVGFNVENGQKLLITLVFLILLFLLRGLIARLLRRFLWRRADEQVRFWSRQGLNLTTAILVILGRPLDLVRTIRHGSPPGSAWSRRVWPSPSSAW